MLSSYLPAIVFFSYKLLVFTIIHPTFCNCILLEKLLTNPCLISGWCLSYKDRVLEAMVLDGIVSSPLRRPHALKKQWDDLGSCSTVVQRHRFLLTAMLLLAFLCTIYIYFAVTLGSRHLSCSGMTGKEKAMCQLQHVQASFSKGKLKFL